jgi:RNA polymerase sigma factor (TIGR02999 family)
MEALWPLGRDRRNGGCKLWPVSEDVSPARVSQWLDEASDGRQEALAALLPLVYAELRRLAAAYLRREQPGQTLQPTALVHEAYLRLAGERHVRWQNRAHFCAIAANSMRQILIEKARARHAQKRGGGWLRLSLDERLGEGPGTDVDLEALDEALTRLERFDKQRARLVELRFFGGLTIEETAEVLGVSPATVKRGWSLARAWLRKELQHGSPGSDA